jgi:hypothetical protein
MKRCISGLATAALFLGGLGQASADIVQLFSPAELNGSDTTAIYTTGADGDHFPSPYVQVAGTNTLTFSDAPTVGFLRVDQGNSWTGAFPNGTRLLWGIDSAGGFSYGGSDTISFANGVTEAGLQVQQDRPNNTTFTATAFNGVTSFTPITVTVPAGTGAGNLGFIGFRATGSDVITKIVISSVDSSDTTFNNDFAFGPVTFGIAAVPEPSILVVASLGALGMVVYGWRRREREVA